MRATTRMIVVLGTACALGGVVGAAEIHDAARSGDLDQVRALLSADPGLINAQDDSGRTPLHWAARGVHAEVARYLIERGADVTIRDLNQVIPLHSVALRGADEVAALMIDRGADVDAKAITGAAPLHFAVQAGHADTVELLLTRGAALEASDGFGNSTLLLAASSGLQEIVELLLARGASVDHPNARGDTPLTVAHREGHERIVELLVRGGADRTKLAELARPEGAYLGQKPPGQAPVLFAPRIVSTERAQLNAVFSPDGTEFYFTQRRPGGSSITKMTMEDSVWSRPTPVSFSSPHADVDHFMTRDGQKMYFCSTRPLTPGAEPRRDADIWVAERSGDSWGQPRHLGPPVNSEGDDYYPTLADDGTLYMSSNREGSLGQNDLYRLSRAGGAGSTIEHLPAPINTPHWEFDPFVSPDHSFLIFASNRPGGHGDDDLYISFRQADGSWSDPRNMGPSVNSEATDFTPMLSPDGKYLFLTSRRGGVSDLYWVDARVIDDLRQTPPDNEALTGPYLGQEPPGFTPRVFAPSLLSRTKPQWAFCAEFSPDHRELYYSREDPERKIDQIVWMRRVGESWTDPEPAPFNTPHNTNDSRLSPDGRTLYFRSQRPLPGSDTPEERLLLWSVGRSEDGWDEPRPVLFGNRPALTSHAGVAANGTVYFSFRAENNVGESDVHRSVVVDGSHGEPENLGAEINTRYAEGDTYIAPDESVLIVTIWDHPDNSGESDLYISFRKPDGSWSSLRNMGKPVNTDANENCAAFSPDGKYFFYVAVDSKGGRTRIDTHWVDARVIDALRPD